LEDDPALKECQNCSGLDILAPSSVVVQSFGLPIADSLDDYYNAKVPTSGAADWIPGTKGHINLEYSGGEDDTTQNIAGYPALQEQATPQSGMSFQDDFSSPTPKSFKASPKAAGAPQMGLQEAPTPMSMEAEPDMSVGPPAKPATPVKAAWRKEASVRDVLDETCWCWYCACQGCGFRLQDPTHPRCECDCVGCRSLLQGIPFGSEGCCQCVHVLGCCTCISEFPAEERSACCLLCGDPCFEYCPRQMRCCGAKPKKAHGAGGAAGGGGGGGHEAGGTKYEELFHHGDTCFCCCIGVGQCCVPDCDCRSSCCCVKCQNGLLMPTCARGCCNCLVTWAWCYGQVWMPPQYHFNPGCALCGLRCRKKSRA